MKKVKDEFMKFIKSYARFGVAVSIVMGQAVAKVIN